MSKLSILNSGKRTIKLELQAISDLAARIDQSFCRACDIVLDCEGRVVVVGMGKSGHIANKIAATLASTGTPAFFVHPAEASHGDIGMITRKDVVLALSNSGSTAEIVTILPLIKRINAPLISMTGDPNSTLATAADANLDVSVKQEACPLNLAPTSSTTASLVMGDALAIALLEKRGFTAEDFAFSHPGGALGKRLLLKVSDVMHTGDSLPMVPPNTPLPEALLEMTEKGLGMTTIVDDAGRLEGIYTDGDLRRTLDQAWDFHHTTINQVMTSGGKTVTPDMLAAEALHIMEYSAITGLVAVDKRGHPVGVVHLHDLIKAGLA
jgi:arabinose-5-phosphate isomerase